MIQYRKLHELLSVCMPDLSAVMIRSMRRCCRRVRGSQGTQSKEIPEQMFPTPRLFPPNYGTFGSIPILTKDATVVEPSYTQTLTTSSEVFRGFQDLHSSQGQGQLAVHYVQGGQGL